MKPIALFALVLISGTLLTSSAGASVGQKAGSTLYTKYSNLTYCTIGGYAQKMDLYIPTSPGGLHSVVLWVPGGGWNTTGVTQLSPGSLFTWFINNFTKMGIAVASIGYSGYPQALWPSQIEEVKCAVRFLRADASTYGLNPYEVGAYGRSVGGHLVALLGLAGTHVGWDNVGQYLTYPSSVKAVLDVSGPTNLTINKDFQAQTDQEIDSIFGSTYQDELVASPVNYMNALPPAFLLLYGLNDTHVYPDQAMLFQNYLRSQGVNSELVLVDNAGHGLTGIPGYNEKPPLSQTDQDSFNFFASELTSTAGPSLSLAVSAASISLGSAVTGTATISGGSAPTGNLTFTAYASSQCTVETQVFNDTTNAAGDGQYTSIPFTPTQVGTYYFVVSYLGDSANKQDNSMCGAAGTMVTVSSSSEVTVAASPTSITLGQSGEATATILGNSPTGTVTFTAYSSSSCGSSSLVYSGSPLPVSGNGVYTSGAFTPSQTGTYYWTAHYSGDANNPPASNTCGSIGSALTVGPATPGISISATPGKITTGQSGSASATLNGGVNPTGTITFDLYNSSTCAVGSVVHSKTVAVTGDGTYVSDSYTPLVAQSYYWTATYSGDGGNYGVSTSCREKGSTLVVASIPMVTAFGYTVSPLNGDPTLGSGVITFSLNITGGAPVIDTITGLFSVTSTSSLSCAGGSSVTISTSISPGGTTSFSLSCSYSGASGRTVTSSLAVAFTDSNGASGTVSGSPGSLTYTIET